MGNPAISLIVAVARARQAEHEMQQHRLPRDPVWRRVVLVVRPKT